MIYNSSRSNLCRSCYHPMDGIHDKTIRNTCHDCGGSSLVVDSAPRLAARKIAREEFGRELYQRAGMI